VSQNAKKAPKNLQEYLDACVVKYNRPDFITDDPISIPHLFSKKQDQEIMGFWSAMLAWGQRKTIINKSRELIDLMGGSPHDFILHHKERDRKAFINFKHRTFQPIDCLYFLEFFQQYYQKHDSLEDAFVMHMNDDDLDTKNALTGFHQFFFNSENAPPRTKKHVATPERKSSCKRLNMFLRWMVRDDANGVDLGIWSGIKTSQLVIPLDLHVQKVARKFQLLHRKQNDWNAAIELTEALRQFDPKDPVKYDYALFGLSVNKDLL